MLKKSGFLFVVGYILLMSACSDDRSVSEPLGDRFIMHDPQVQKRVENNIGNISYYKDSEGYIVYSLYDHALVLGAIRKAQDGDELNPNITESLLVKNESQKITYIREMKRESIVYHIMVGPEGNEHITWSQLFGPQMDNIRQRVRLDLLSTNSEVR